MLDQAERLRRLVNGEEQLTQDRKAKIITVTSGKGGVGKSNFVVNLSILLQRRGKKVLIFDADIGMGNDDVLMGVYPRYNIFDLIKGRNIEEILVDGPEGVKLLPGGSGLNQVEDLQDNEREIFLNKLESLNGFDYIIMDTGAGINRSVLAFIACSEEVIIVTTPEPTSLTDAYSLIKATNHFDIKDRAKIVVNKTFTESEGIETFNKFERAVNKFLSLRVEYLGNIPDDRKLIQGVRKQIPFTISYPNSEASRATEKIAERILGDESQSKIGAQGLFKKLFNLFY